MASLENINAGEILLKELCDYFNHEIGYDPIEDIMNIHSDDKQELLKFINRKTNERVIVGKEKCQYQLRSLNRLIKNTKDKKLLGKIPSSNATLCTLCYVVLKRKNEELQFASQTSHGETHGQSFYATDFTKEFIVPLLANTPNLQPIPKDFRNSCWYLFINVVDKVTSQRKTGRKVLKLATVENEDTIVEYYSTNMSTPDWAGTAQFHSSKRQLCLNLKTYKNDKRCMIIEFQVNITLPTKIIEGDISYTSMKDLDEEIHTKIYLVKADCSLSLSLKEYNEGEDHSIKEIENKLKLVKATTKRILPSHDCHDC